MLYRKRGLILGPAFEVGIAAMQAVVVQYQLTACTITRWTCLKKCLWWCSDITLLRHTVMTSNDRAPLGYKTVVFGFHGKLNCV